VASGDVQLAAVGPGHVLLVHHGQKRRAQSREICVVFHLYNANHRQLLGERGCRVVAPGKEGHILSSAFVDLDLLKQAKSGQALPFESHTIYNPKSSTS